MKQRERCAAVVAGITFIFAALARAAEPCLLLPGQQGDEIVFSDVASAFPEISEKLAKGLSVTLVHQVVAEDSTGTFVSACRIFYDLWEEKYFVAVDSTLSGAPKKTSSQKFGEALGLCSRALLPKGFLNGSGKIEAVTILNPVSEEQVERTRKWLAERGVGGASGPILGRAVGALVDLKERKGVRRICTRVDKKFNS